MTRPTTTVYNQSKPPGKVPYSVEGKAMSRIFLVRVNTDDMFAELDTLRPDQHGEWLAGFRAGSRGRIPDGWDGPRLMGAEFGMSCYRSAEDFRAAASAAGKRSVAARRAMGGNNRV